MPASATSGEVLTFVQAFFRLYVLRRSLWTKILIAILAAVLVTDALGPWAVNNRLQAGARQEANTQAQAHTAQTRVLRSSCVK